MHGSSSGDCLTTWCRGGTDRGYVANVLFDLAKLVPFFDFVEVLDRIVLGNGSSQGIQPTYSYHKALLDQGRELLATRSTAPKTLGRFVCRRVNGHKGDSVGIEDCLDTRCCRDDV
jgi:hypothetical protein